MKSSPTSCILMLCFFLAASSLWAADVAAAKILQVPLGNSYPMKFIRISPRSQGINYPDFYISETEVTNAQFKRYLDSARKKKDDRQVLEIVKQRDKERAFSTGDIPYSIEDEKTIWRDNAYPKGLDDHPVALVTLADVSDFCGWLTRSEPTKGLFRLPSWNEWMVAAYGRNRKYPWGEKWDPTRVHTSFGISWKTRPLRTEPVTARPQGKTPEGVYGMIGNVTEYILDTDPTAGHYLDLGSRFMGGGFQEGGLTEKDETLPPRKDYWGYFHHSTGRECSLGFRVVLDPTSDKTLINRPPFFDQNDKSWMIAP